MPRRPPPGTLPIDVVARILHTQPSHFRQWLRDGPLESRQLGLSEFDALKAALWRRLSDTLGPKPARLAFGDVLRELQDRSPIGRFDVVFDVANGGARVCTADRQVSRACLAAGHVHVLALGGEFDRVRQAFHKHLEVEGPPPARGSAPKTAAGASSDAATRSWRGARAQSRANSSRGRLADL